MKILAIETSTLLGGIAITDDASGLIAEVRLNVKSTHSERLMTEIDHLLKQSGLELADMDVFAIATGPGSFTGLRIGLSTVKGFSYATGKPVVSVPTLEALAWNFPYCKYPVCTMLDARKKEVYAALFQWRTDGFARIIDEVSVNAERLLEYIFALRLTSKDIAGNFPQPIENILFTGEGAILYQDVITEIAGEKAIFATPGKMVPSPGNVAWLGLKRARMGEYTDPISLVPFYIRRSEAEIKWHA
jgi:tRNA threonylcarbamoyladenosine biosynthesis protein TsaB